ncbi:hypothetical protein ACWDSJ_06675 [Nocardia sp. NPDC003482]
MLPKRKPLDEPALVVLGYINARHLPPGDGPWALGSSMRVSAVDWEFDWGGTFLDRNTHGETVAALTRAAARDPRVALVVVPAEEHRPDGLYELRAGGRLVRVVTAAALGGRRHAG